MTPGISRTGAVYTLTLLSGLYTAQGLPYGFFTQALPVLMREAGLSLKAISLTAVLFLPWAFKFVWGPLIDRVGSPRRWLLPLQLSAAATAAMLTQVNLEDGFGLLFAAFFFFNLIASLQDVVTDGLAVRLLDHKRRGLANGIQVGAYRIGMVLGGGLLLYVYAKAGWRPMFWSMSAMLLLCALPVLRLQDTRETVTASQLPVRELLSGWWTRLRQPGVLSFILLIAAYKFGDTMAASLISPFMKDLDLSKEQIALIKGTFGSGAGLAGAAIGGWFAWRFGRRAALLVCGLTQTLSVGIYAFVAIGPLGLPGLWTACIAEHLFGGMATVALFTLMMDASEHEHAGTDYALYACAIVFTQALASFAGAAMGDAYGYAPTFVAATILSAIGCWLLVSQLDRSRGPARLTAVWQP